MNRVFGLRCDNAYPDDCNFLVIPYFYNVKAKLQLGARWFDDIVSSNRIKQNAQDSCTEPDFQ